MQNVLLSLFAGLVLLIGADAAGVNQIETPRMRRFGPAEGLPSGKLELVQQSFDPSQLAQELADFMHPIAEARGLRFHYRNQLLAHLVVLGDATRVRQILINLLGNAIKFAERGEVALLISQHGGNLRFKVRDSGPGIRHRAGAAQTLVSALRTGRRRAHQFALPRQRFGAGDLPGAHRGDEGQDSHA